MSEWNTAGPKSAVCVVKRGQRNHLRVANVARCFCTRKQAEHTTPEATRNTFHSLEQSIPPLKEVDGKHYVLILRLPPSTPTIHDEKVEAIILPPIEAFFKDSELYFLLEIVRH